MESEMPPIDQVFRTVQLEAELPGIANRCLAAYRELLRRGHFVQPKTAAPVAKRMATDANPIADFMQECWIKDDKARPGPYAAQVHLSFQFWCEEHGRSNLLDTYKREQELMKAIGKLHEWSWLKRVRATGATAGRYPGIRRLTKEDKWEGEEEAEETEVIEAPEEIVTEIVVVAPRGWRRF
jgi:hypothetical protein